jgi:8-oxo-dGTP diphosphatase
VSRWRTWQYRLSRLLGRVTVRLAAALTVGRMPSFVSASAVVIRDGQVLVVVDPIRNEPVLPGGHLHWDEDPCAAVVREVREETGLTVEPGNLIGVFAGRQWAGEPGIVRVVYAAAVTSGNLRSSPEGEASWLPLVDVLRTRTRDAPILRSYLNHGSPAGIPN